MEKSPSFLSELKRRNVYKVAAAYAVISWLLIQIATQVFPFFEIPNWAVRLVVILLILGFPVALVCSWLFEITTKGIMRESEVEPHESITKHTGRKIVGLTIVVAIAAAGLLAYQLFRPKKSAASAGRATASLATTAAAATAPAVPSISPKSIAVLPFENLSEDKANAFFASGIQDEILTRLSKIGALKVISRTSTQQYQSNPGNLIEIAKQLGVANILEGSVQKAGDAVHINVQLINAATDEHLWAESYDRELKNIFGVEGEVAGAIAQALRTTLTGSEEKAMAEKPTQNVEAYNSYLRGLSIERAQYNYWAYQRAADAYAQAVQFDPEFAQAWARLAVLRSFLYFNTIDRRTNSAAAVQLAADRAMAIAPDAAESWIARGAYLYRVVRDFEESVSAYQEAEKRSPNNAYLLENLAYVQRRLGRWQDAETNFKKAIELDPRDVAMLSSVGAEFYSYLRRFDDARALLDRAVAIEPQSETAHSGKADILQKEDRLADAARELAQIPEDSTDDYVVNSRVQQALYERNFEKVIAVVERKLQALKPDEPLDTFTQIALVELGFCQEWTGKHAEARQTFARALQSIKPTPDTVVGPEANGVPSTLALAYAGLGEKQKALEQAQQGVSEYHDDAINQPGAMIVLAQIQALFGDHEAAIAALPHLLDVPAGLTRANLKLDPFWDPLRQDPRFEKLSKGNEAAK